MNETLAVVIGIVARFGVPFLVMMLIGNIVTRRPVQQH